MKWFIIDYEISIYGKDSETVFSTDKDTAITIALVNIEKKTGFKKQHIHVTNCKVIKN